MRFPGCGCTASRTRSCPLSERRPSASTSTAGRGGAQRRAREARAVHVPRELLRARRDDRARPRGVRRRGSRRVPALHDRGRGGSPVRRVRVARLSRPRPSLLTFVPAACVPEAAAVRPGTIGAPHDGAAKRDVPLPVPNARVPVAFLVAGASGQRHDASTTTINSPAHSHIVAPPGSLRASFAGVEAASETARRPNRRAAAAERRLRPGQSVRRCRAFYVIRKSVGLACRGGGSTPSARRRSEVTTSRL